VRGLVEVAERCEDNIATDEHSIRSADACTIGAKGQKPEKKSVCDLGPKLPGLRWWEKLWHVAMYTIGHQKFRISAMGIFILFVILGAGAFRWSELQLPLNSANAPEGIIEWLLNAQTILGMGTLLVALFVWIGEMEKDWEDSLPKRLSVFFFWKGKPLIVCRYVWLAGKDEIRVWGQQVGVQAQETLPHEKPQDSFLHFEPDMQTRGPELLKGPGGSVWKHYSICFKLTDLNTSLRRTKEYCRYQNVAATNKAASNFPIDLVESIPEVSRWKEGMI